MAAACDRPDCEPSRAVIPSDRLGAAAGGQTAGGPRVVIRVGDCLEVLGGLPAASVDAICTDPPYELTAGKRGGSGEASVNLDSPYGRARIGTGNGGGFMGKAWDSTGVAFDPATWVEALRVLKPGGHLLAFGGTRTYHRLACAIEDAGFEIRDCLAWLYGSGFPKSLNLSGDRDGWGTALKPAHEPIVLARKPLTGTVAANVQAHGTGALNVDGCRIDFQGAADKESAKPGGAATAKSGALAGGTQHNGERAEFEAVQGTGRWPANVLLDPAAAAMLDEQTGTLRSGEANVRRASGADRNGNTSSAYGATSRPSGSEMVSYGDSGGASRFFYCAKASSAERSAGLDDFEAKGTTADGYGSIQTPKLDRAAPRENWTPHPVRNSHPTVKPIELMRWLVRLITPPGGLVLDPFTGSGTTGIAAHLEGFEFVGIERDADYAAIADARIEWWSRHPDGMELVRRLELEQAQQTVRDAGQLGFGF